MTGTVAAIDQAIFDAMRGVDYLRPAIVRPYFEFAEIPSAVAGLRDYYQDKEISKKLAVSLEMTAELGKKIDAFISRSENARADLATCFAENADKIEPRHLDNLEKWAEDLENAAHKGSAEGVALLKPLRKKFKLLARERSQYKQGLEDLLNRIFTAGDKVTEEAYDMALFLRALRAEYNKGANTSAYFNDSEAMRAYLRGLVA